MSEEHQEPEPRPDVTRLFDLLGRPIDIRSIALTGIFVLLLLYTLYFAKAFLLPIVLALLLNFLLGPVVRLLRKAHIPQGVGAAIVLLALLGVVVTGVYRLSGPAAQWFDRTPQGLQRIERRVRQLGRPVQEVQQAAEQVEREVERIATGSDGRRTQVEVEGRSWSGVILSQTQAFLAGAAVTMVLLYFLLASGDLFLRKLVRVLPRLSDKKAAIEIARATEHHISMYLSTLTLINVALGIAVGAAMKLTGLPNPVLWGVVAGLLNFIPYLGPLVTLTIITLVSVLHFDELSQALLPPLAYFAINFVEGGLVTPALHSRRLTMNPVMVFMGLIFWTWLWGIPGALLAVPILATFKIFCDHIPPLAPIGEFLGR